MRDLERNKRLLYYANATGKTEVLDSNGYRTGAYQVQYDTPKPLRINVQESGSTGRNGAGTSGGIASQNDYGIHLGYTYLLVTHDMRCPLKEDSVVWFGVPTDGQPNFAVVKVARSINSIAYAIKQVDKS